MRDQITMQLLSTYRTFVHTNPPPNEADRTDQIEFRPHELIFPVLLLLLLLAAAVAVVVLDPSSIAECFFL